jgi:hypothetical protein
MARDSLASAERDDGVRGIAMLTLFGFAPERPVTKSNSGANEALAWIATHSRKVAQGHMDLAEKAEALMEQFLDNCRFRTGLRTFARHHRRAAWQHLEMARRADAARWGGPDEFDLVDVVSAT